MAAIYRWHAMIHKNVYISNHRKFVLVFPAHCLWSVLHKKKEFDILHLPITVWSSDTQTMLCVEVRLKLIKFDVFKWWERKIMVFWLMMTCLFPSGRRICLHICPEYGSSRFLQNVGLWKDKSYNPENDNTERVKLFLRYQWNMGVDAGHEVQQMIKLK